MYFKWKSWCAPSPCLTTLASIQNPPHLTWWQSHCLCLLKPNNLVSSLTLVFLSHSIPSPSGNSVDRSSKCKHTLQNISFLTFLVKQTPLDFYVRLWGIYIYLQKNALQMKFMWEKLYRHPQNPTIKCLTF